MLLFITVVGDKFLTLSLSVSWRYFFLISFFFITKIGSWALWPVLVADFSSRSRALSTSAVSGSQSFGLGLLVRVRERARGLTALPIEPPVIELELRRESERS